MYTKDTGWWGNSTFKAFGVSVDDRLKAKRSVSFLVRVFTLLLQNEKGSRRRDRRKHASTPEKNAWPDLQTHQNDENHFIGQVREDCPKMYISLLSNLRLTKL
jgi:hypothetical protein